MITIKHRFAPDMDICTITVMQDGIEYTYSNLRVKKTNLRDWNDPQFVYQVFIPCHKALGRDYMLCAGRDAVYSYIHPERKAFTFTLEVDEIVVLPKRGKKKSGQLALFGGSEK